MLKYETIYHSLLQKIQSGDFPAGQNYHQLEAYRSNIFVVKAQ